MAGQFEFCFELAGDAGRKFCVGLMGVIDIGARRLECELVCGIAHHPGRGESEPLSPAAAPVHEVGTDDAKA